LQDISIVALGMVQMAQLAVSCEFRSFYSQNHECQAAEAKYISVKWYIFSLQNLAAKYKI